VFLVINIIGLYMKAVGKVFSGLVAPLFGDTLKARCARSTFVLGIGVFVAKFLGFGSKVILTRLLAPQDMGLMVMILSLTALFEVLTEIGIKQSVIQHKNGDDTQYLNMAWWFQSVRAVGLYAVAFIVAPLLCNFYFRSKPEVLTRYSMGELTNLVRVAFFTLLFNGFVSPKAYILEKTFRFGRALLITQGSLVLGAVLTIILAFVIKNVWAIVIGVATAGFAKCLLSYALCPFLPKFTYHRESFRDLYRFASGVFGLSILAYIAFNMDVLVAGKLISTSLVGLYGMALVLALAPWDLFSGMINIDCGLQRNDIKPCLWCRIFISCCSIRSVVCLRCVSYTRWCIYQYVFRYRTTEQTPRGCRVSCFCYDFVNIPWDKVLWADRCRSGRNAGKFYRPVCTTYDDT
jgi:hypothetical protein